LSGRNAFEKYDPKRAKALVDYFEYARDNDPVPFLHHHQSAGRQVEGIGSPCPACPSSHGGCDVRIAQTPDGPKPAF
jgi:hypothetical protein